MLSEPKETRLFLTKTLAKIAQVVVQSRVPFPREAPRQPNNWLNLVTDEVIDVRNQVRASR